MGCVTGTLPGGGTYIACTRGRRPAEKKCSVCGSPNVFYQCDAPRADYPSLTCDANLCQAHVKPQSEGVDYCPKHDSLAHFKHLREGTHA